MSDEKSLIERIEENKRILKAEYQRGFADGGNDMNEKWLITTQEFISEFVKKIGYFTDTCDDSDYGDNEESPAHKYWIKIQKEYEEKLK